MTLYKTDDGEGYGGDYEADSAEAAVRMHMKQFGRELPSCDMEDPDSNWYRVQVEGEGWFKVLADEVPIPREYWGPELLADPPISVYAVTYHVFREQPEPEQRNSTL